MFTLLSHWFALARTAHDRRRAVESLSRLSDAQLLDLGLERGTVEENVRKGLPSPSFETASVQPLRPLRHSLQGCG